MSNSYHTRGLAADIAADDMRRLLWACVLQDELSYIEAHDTYIHVDVGRTRRERLSDQRTVKEAVEP